MREKFDRVPRWALYTASSMLSSSLDYSIYLFLSRVAFTSIPGSLPIHLAFTTGRLSGGLCNFTINEKIVFQPRPKGRGARLVRYLMMLAFIAFLGNWLLAQLHTVRELNDLLAKLLTDVTMFLVGYMLQRFFVFRKRPHGSGDNRPAEPTGK